MFAEDSNIDLCVNYIEEGKCILFLGPQFAMEHSGEKIHEQLKTQLQKSEFKEQIDYSFDNLFIFKESKPRTGEKMRLNIELKKRYKSFKPHEIYQKIAFIPFSAIISCSPDQFLKKAYEDNQLDFNFRYYSRKGGVDENENLSKGATFFYNVFGNIDNEDSLITTYEGFFKFIISIMGEEQRLPIELRNQIVNAKIFIFMGFDLTKWYIPLLIHKLHSFKREGDDATAVVNKDNTLDETTEKYFPIELMVLNGDSLPTINAIYDKLFNKGKLRHISKREESRMVESLKQLIVLNEFEQVFRKLSECYAERKMEANAITSLEARHHNLRKDVISNNISESEAGLERSKIVNNLLILTEALNAPAS